MLEFVAWARRGAGTEIVAGAGRGGNYVHSRGGDGGGCSGGSRIDNRSRAKAGV